MLKNHRCSVILGEPIWLFLVSFVSYTSFSLDSIFPVCSNSCSFCIFLFFFMVIVILALLIFFGCCLALISMKNFILLWNFLKQVTHRWIFSPK